MRLISISRPSIFMLDTVSLRLEMKPIHSTDQLKSLSRVRKNLSTWSMTTLSKLEIRSLPIQELSKCSGNQGTVR